MTTFKGNDGRHGGVYRFRQRVRHGHPRKTTLDHKTPLTRGGTWALDNLVIACGRCNGEKADMPFDVYIDFRRKLLRGGDRDALLAAIRALDAPTVTRIR